MNPADEKYLRLAIEQAAAAAGRGEVPIGAALVSEVGELLAVDGNRIIERHDPTAHAEILALRSGAFALGNERLAGTTLYVSLEPCAMCAGAISLARVARLVYAAVDAKGGAVESGVRFFEQPTCHHRPQLERAHGFDDAGQMLKDFFRARR